MPVADWINQIPLGAKPRYVALLVHRHESPRAWGRAVKDLQDAGVEVDVEYLRTERDKAANFPRLKERARQQQREARRE